MNDLDPILDNVRLALASGADPAMLLTVALASMSPESIEEAFDQLYAKKAAICELVNAGPGDQARRPAVLEPDLSLEPELGRMRPDLGDHEIRGRLLFRDLLGRTSFFQLAAFAIGGVSVTGDQAAYIEHCGLVTQLLDPKIWGLAVARRVGARSTDLAHALIAGLACLCTPRMTGQPVGAFMRFLDDTERQMKSGTTLDEWLDDILARGERIPGIGRPVAGPDERVPEIKKLAGRYDLASGRSWRLALAIDVYFRARGKPGINSAGLHGALMRDFGFSPSAASALSMIYFVLPVLANAVYLENGPPSAENVSAIQNDV